MERLNDIAVEPNPYSGLMNECALKNISSCCRQTIRSHVAHNPMMVCPDCKTMIKCFLDEKSFLNYQTFCRSRSRKLQSFTDSGVWFVMFNSFLGSVNG